MTKNKLVNNLEVLVSDFEFQLLHVDTDSINQENTPANPVESEHACIDRHGLNEAYCRAALILSFSLAIQT